MDYQERVLHLLEKSGGIVTTSMLQSEKIPTVYLTRMNRKGIIERVDRGIYRIPGGVYDEYFFFSLKYPKIIYSYTSALYLFGYTDQIPENIEITVYSGYNASRINKDVKIHYIKKEYHELGKTSIETMFSNVVPFYNIERTICDLVSERDKIEVEVFAKAIQRYTSSKGKDLNLLFEYAKKLKILDKVRDIMEVQL
jgi:predicted transcriptional regulator of viral defense system